MTHPTTRRRTRTTVALAAILLSAGHASAAAPSSTPDAAGAERNLARYFGFDAPRFIVVDQGLGPVAIGDFNSDGRLDLAIVNNRKSRIEVHLQRAASRAEEPAAPAAQGARRASSNELPPSEWFDRVDIPLRQRVSALAAQDIDKDSRTDLIYAGEGNQLVVLRQTEAGRFDELSRTRVPGLSATKDGLRFADVMGPPGSGVELVTLVNGRIRVFPLDERGRLGEHIELGASDGARDQIVAVYCADFTGNGLTDIVGIAPDSATPIRLWPQESNPYDASPGARGRRPGAELRFESPPLRDAQPVAFANRAASSLAVVERATNRVAVFDFVEKNIEPPAPTEGRVSERDLQADILPLPGAAAAAGADRSRSVVVADISSNGMTDLLAADASGNALLLFAQKRGVPIREPQRFSAFKSPKALSAGRWHSPRSGPLDVFVLSEEEKTVGVSRFENGRLSFPQPITLKTAGATPHALSYVDLGDNENPRPALAVVVELRREVFLEIHEPDAAANPPRAVKLDGVRRPPSAILSADVDQDGAVDLLLMTPGEPMVMVQGASSSDEESLRVLTDRQMPQFGLVQAAGPDNTALFDINDDGAEELLIADANFVRAAKFDASTGWRVVEQITDPETRGRFTGLTILREGSTTRIVAADRAARRLVVFEKADAGWRVADRMRLAGVEPAAIFAGSFSGDSQPNLLALSADAMGIVRFGGTRIAAEAVASFRADADRRVDHDLESGDLNSDGFTDLVVLDAGLKMATILTFTARRDLLFATEFEVFQSRLFEAEQQRDLQPAQSIIADLTGDGADDLILLVHDRVIIYPQATAKPATPRTP